MCGPAIPERIHADAGDRSRRDEFPTGAPGKPIPSPAVLGQITTRFREAVEGFAEAHEIPWIEFRSNQRKGELANRLRRERGVRDGMGFIGVAQEKAKAFQAKARPEKAAGCFNWTRDKDV